MPSIPRQQLLLPFFHDHNNSEHGATCRTCRILKSFDHFYFKSSGRRITQCIACHRAAAHARYMVRFEQNAEEIRAKERAYCTANRDKIRAKKKRWKARHKDVVLAREASKREANREQLREYHKRWRAENIEHAREYDRIFSHRRRAQLVGSGGSHTSEEWTAIKKAQNYMCLMCGRSEPEIKLTRDHVLPVSRGGTDFADNIQGLCGSCNSRKNAKHIDFRISSS